MNILITVKDCADPALGPIIIIIKRALTIIQIVGPIILILALTINLTKGVFNPEDKKSMKKLFNSILATLILFFLPIFINIFMGVLGENFTVSSCWNNVSVSNKEPEYIPYDNNEEEENNNNSINQNSPRR